MHNAWNPAREITMRAVGENRFVIQCFCLGDWEKVTERGPWLFREWPLIMAPYDGFSDPEQIELNFMPIWVQVHKIPEGYRKKEDVVRNLISRACGEIMALEMIPAGGFKGDFVRARIRHDVRKPLTRFVSIMRGGTRSLYAVKYEKLGLICFACGLIGHGQKECGVGIYEGNKLKFGEWIYVTPPSSRGRNTGVLRGGLRGGFGDNGRGRGHGRGVEVAPGSFADWRLHPERTRTGAGVVDAATSLVKYSDVHMTEAEKLAKRSLNLELPVTALGDSTNVAAAVAMDVPSARPVVDDREQGTFSKRTKRDDGTSASNNSAGSAASLEDDRRAQ
jgi:hypothetical protein